MKKNLVLLILIFIVIPAIFGVYYIVSRKNVETPMDFNMIFKYGVKTKNELNTFNGTYTKDMILDPSIAINLSLSQEELNSIYKEMVEINFFDYPEKFSFKHSIIPYSKYYFKVQYNNRVKELSWDESTVLDDTKANKLQELISYIISLIESKKEYKNLPQPKGGYE